LANNLDVEVKLDHGNSDAQILRPAKHMFSNFLFLRHPDKDKCKGHPRTAKKAQRRSRGIGITWALDGVGGQRHAPTALPP
jgi:hypothetical protein